MDFVNSVILSVELVLLILLLAKNVIRDISNYLLGIVVKLVLMDFMEIILLENVKNATMFVPNALHKVIKVV